MQGVVNKINILANNGQLKRGVTIKEIKESQEKDNRITVSIEVKGVVKAMCSFYKSTTADIYTEKYFSWLYLKG